MAAVYGSFDFVNISTNQQMIDLFAHLHPHRPVLYTLVISLGILWPVVIVGNVAVLYAIWKDPLKLLRPSPTITIIGSMAVCDLMVGIGYIPSYMYWFIWRGLLEKQGDNNLIDQLHVFFDCMNYISLYHVLYLTCDRFIAVHKPLHHSSIITRKRCITAIVPTWITWAAIGILSTFYTSAVYAGVIFICVIVAILLIFILSGYILHSIKRHSKIITDESANNSLRDAINARERKTTKLIAIVVGIFLVSFLPWFISGILLLLCSPCYPNASILISITFLSANLLTANSGINVYLYAFRLERFKKTFALWCRKSREAEVLPRVEQEDVFNTKL
ncbi:trace amine-associated receptor 7f [Nematostella vectensis]|uniref:trace amine-associated receptor 7f n=1 Tax=Nematostella vectensis TaxID=45351 RepID=UPI0020774514|nr:trace amine-associated receptor 7f [Nematostella vectensis]